MYMSDYFYLYMNGITKPPPRQKSSGDHLGPKIQKYFNKILSTKIVRTSAICLKMFEKCSKIHLTYIPIYS